MSKKSKTFPCTGVKLLKFFPKQAGKSSGFFSIMVTWSTISSIHKYFISLVCCYRLFHKLQFFSNLSQKNYSISKIFFCLFLVSSPQNSSPNTSKSKTFPCTGAGNKDKYSHLAIIALKEKVWDETSEIIFRESWILF